MELGCIFFLWSEVKKTKKNEKVADETVESRHSVELLFTFTKVEQFDWATILRTREDCIRNCDNSYSFRDFLLRREKDVNIYVPYTPERMIDELDRCATLDAIFSHAYCTCFTVRRIFMVLWYKDVYKTWNWIWNRKLHNCKQLHENDTSDSSEDCDQLIETFVGNKKCPVYFTVFDRCTR